MVIFRLDLLIYAHAVVDRRDIVKEVASDEGNPWMVGLRDQLIPLDNTFVAYLFLTRKLFIRN